MVVRAAFPGANPKVIAETVASPLEQQMNGVEGMLYMFSQATSDGALTLTVTFALGIDLDNAQVQVQNRVAQTLPRLPQDVQRIGVTTEKASPDFIMVVHLVSPDERYDMLYLSNYAHLQVRDELTRLARRRLGAGVRRRRQHARLARSGSSGVAPAHRQRRGPRHPRAEHPGRSRCAGAPPAPSDATFQLSINTQGRLSTESEFGNIVVRATDDGQITRLSDVARLELGSSRYSLRSLLDNKPAVAIGVFQRLRHQRAPASDDVHATMERLKASFPPGVDYRIVYDPTMFARESIDAVAHTLLEAIVLVVIVVVIFLQTWRASIIPLVAVPVSLIGTFAVMLALASRSTRCRCSAWCSPSASSWTTPSWWWRTRNGTSSLASFAARGDEARDGGSTADHRHRARARRGVRADGVRQRPDRPVLPAVRADHRHLDVHLGVQLADLEPGAGLEGCCWRTGAARSAPAHHRLAVRLVLPRLQSSVHAALRSTPAASRGGCASRRLR